MKDEILICDCSSVEHQMVLRFDDDKDLGRQVFVEINLVPLVWYKRLWLGIKYIFGYFCLRRKEITMSNIKLDIELKDDLAGCQIEIDDKVKQWHELDRQEQIKVCNMLAQFYNLFSSCIKEANNE